MNTRSALFLRRHQFTAILLTLMLAVSWLTGCENNKQKQPAVELMKKYDQTTVLEGVVSNNWRQIKAGAIKAIDSDNRLVAGTTLKNSAHYQLEIPAGTVLPIELHFYADAQEGAEKLIAVVIDPTINRYDINPLTTVIAKRAKALGGYTHVNMVRAAEDSVHVPDSNKTSKGFRGDPTTQYGGWH